MVLGPEFGPLAAVAVGVVLRRFDLIKRGALALGVGFPLMRVGGVGVAGGEGWCSSGGGQGGGEQAGDDCVLHLQFSLCDVSYRVRRCG